MRDVMLSLGRFRFSIATAAYDTLTRSVEYRWQPVDRIGRAPAMQFLGQGADTIDLDGTIIPQSGAGLDQVEAMRREADLGTPLTLTAGTGAALGRWVILNVTETGSRFMSRGEARKQTFALRLQAYGEDDDSARGGGGSSLRSGVGNLFGASTGDELLPDPLGSVVLDALLSGGSLSSLSNPGRGLAGTLGKAMRGFAGTPAPSLGTALRQPTAAQTVELAKIGPIKIKAQIGSGTPLFSRPPPRPRVPSITKLARVRR
jgi:hypothetical protein